MRLLVQLRNRTVQFSSFLRPTKCPRKLDTKFDTRSVFANQSKIYDGAFCENSGFRQLALFAEKAP